MKVGRLDGERTDRVGSGWLFGWLVGQSDGERERGGKKGQGGSVRGEGDICEEGGGVTY